MAESPDFQRVLEQVEGIVRDVGWCVINTQYRQTHLAHTVGLSAQGAPELFVLGLEANASRHLLNVLATKLLGGELAIEHGIERDDLLEKNKLVFLSLSEEAASLAKMLVAWSNQKQTPVQGAFQVVWSTDTGLFPWQDSDFTQMQPLLDRPILH